MNYKMFAANGISAKGKLLPFEDFTLGGGLPLLEECRAEVIAAAEKVSPLPPPALPATLFANFVRSGDRVAYETLFFARRNELIALVFAEAYERQGRFTDRIVDRVWAILEETTWVLPAHAEYGARLGNDTLPFSWKEGVTHSIDLFAASTGALLAVALDLVGKELDGFSRELRPRILHALETRILLPYETREDLLWMCRLPGFDIDNWTPWILSNVLTVVALTVKDKTRREALVERAFPALDCYTATYPEDGGCSEGPSYFWEAGCALFDVAEILYDMSGGRISLFGDRLLRAMGEYIPKVHISGKYFLNFSDAPSTVPVQGRPLSRYGAECNSPLMEQFGAAHLEELHVLATHNPYRTLCNLTVPVRACPAPAPEKRVWFDGMQVMALRDQESGLFFAMKGGHNAECHNHNDVGAFVIYADGEPLFADAGNDAYSAATFDPLLRYTLWQNTSAYHNLLLPNGTAQKEGQEFSARTVWAGEDGLTLALEGAYPKEAGLLSYEREGRLTAHGVTVTDRVKFAAPSKADFCFLVAEKPTLDGDVLRFPSGREMTLPLGVSATVEEIPLSSYMQRSWHRPLLWRVVATAEDVLEGTFAFTVR